MTRGEPFRPRITSLPDAMICITLALNTSAPAAPRPLTQPSWVKVLPETAVTRSSLAWSPTLSSRYSPTFALRPGTSTDVWLAKSLMALTLYGALR